MGLIEELLFSGLAPGNQKEDVRWLPSVKSAQCEVLRLICGGD